MVVAGIVRYAGCVVPRAPEENWPSRLWLVRHGESAGNVASNAAEAAGLPIIQIAQRDMDVPLSPLGEQQARALGRWFGEKAEAERPTVVLSSPYARALETTALLTRAGRLHRDKTLIEVADERLREKEFGSLNRLTRAGILASFPREAELRAQVGKFYYRPPGGESWCDVILRLRSVLDTIQLQHQGERVLVVAHQVIVLCMRYLLERMTEQQILSIDARGDVANCSVTTYDLRRDDAGRTGLWLTGYNDLSPLEQAGAEVTDEPDAPVAPR